MKIIVVGCGKIGRAILSSLIEEGHDVVVIDDDPEVIEEITNIYDAMGVSGNATDCVTLSEAGVENCELFVSVTGSDELNMLSCFLARRMGAKHTIARIRNPEYNENSLGLLSRQLDISFPINPERLTALEIYNILKLPGAATAEVFSGNNFEIVELILRDDSPLIGMNLAEVRKKYPAKFLICAVQCGDQVYIPDGNFELKKGDKVGLTATPEEFSKLLRMLGIQKKQSKNVMILGATRTSYYLAKMLLRSGMSVKIIDKDRDRCEEFDKLLPGAVLICGDGAEQELLLEEGIRTTDAFAALTGIDEENILISFFAASQNVPKVVSKVNRGKLASMAEKLGLDCLVSPQNIISGVLARYARALENSIGSNVETLYKVLDGKAEALEFNVGADFRSLGVPLREMELKPNLLIAGILRRRKTVIPSGDDVILEGDKVIILSTDHRLNDLSDILR